jgi:hypothetical protein
MPVVINELEVTPAPPGKTESSGGKAANQEGPAAIKPDTLHEIEKDLRRKHERIHRLTAC